MSFPSMHLLFIPHSEPLHQEDVTVLSMFGTQMRLLRERDPCVMIDNTICLDCYPKLEHMHSNDLRSSSKKLSYNLNSHQSHVDLASDHDKANDYQK